jgi:hypothetical protein
MKPKRSQEPYLLDIALYGTEIVNGDGQAEVTSSNRLIYAHTHTHTLSLPLVLQLMDLTT